MEFDIKKILLNNTIQNEYERAHSTRVYSRWAILYNKKTDKKLLDDKEKLAILILEYENKHWSDEGNISDELILESDLAEIQVQKEYDFMQKEKE